MKNRNIHNNSLLSPLVAGMIAGLVVFSQAVVAQSSADKSAMPRMLDGHPDLQGTWDFRTLTPMERPSAMGEKSVLSFDEAANFESGLTEQTNRDNFTDTTQTGDYNQFWYDYGTQILDDNRTSLITDPADGRIPALTEEGQARRAVYFASYTDADGVELRPLAERCIMGFNSGPPMAPSAYNNNVQLVQTQDYFLIFNEMVHNSRIVRMDANEHRDIPRNWEGDSIGHWEGDTLVVETRNFLRDTGFVGSTENLHLTERFSLINGNMLAYEFTVDDPTTWVNPWTAMFPMRRAELPMYEYACHEGNYSLAGVLGGARRLEQISKAAAAK